MTTRRVSLFEADAGVWPQGWDGTEVRGDVLLPQVMEDGSVQPLLGLEGAA